MTVELEDGPKKRVHILNNLDVDLSDATDAHLAKFQLQNHQAWFDNFLRKTDAIAGHERNYETYTKSWFETKGLPSAQLEFNAK